MFDYKKMLSAYLRLIIDENVYVYRLDDVMTGGNS